MSNFNFIAPYYDRLVTLVFSSKLLRAKTQFMHYIRPGNVVLLVGEGTGNILNTMLASVKNLQVDYLEPSGKMLALAKQNLDPAYAKQVRFIQGGHDQVPAGAQYDAVCTFFVFDIFSQAGAFGFATKINGALKKEGTWLFADFFSTGKLYHKLLVRLMYLFFMLFTGISATSLPDYNSIFRHLRLTMVDEASFNQGLIRARVYKKEYLRFAR